MRLEMSKQKKSMSVVETVFIETLKGKRFIKSLPATKRNLAFMRDQPRQIEMYNTAMCDRLLIDVKEYKTGRVPDSDIAIWHRLYSGPYWLKHFGVYDREKCLENVLQFSWVKKPFYFFKQTPLDKQDLPIKFQHLK